MQLGPHVIMTLLHRGPAMARRIWMGLSRMLGTRMSTLMVIVGMALLSSFSLVIFVLTFAGVCLALVKNIFLEYGMLFLLFVSESFLGLVLYVFII